MAGEVARYAVLLHERSESLFGMGGPTTTVATLIKSVDGGNTWTGVDFRDAGDVRRVADAMNRDASERAVAGLRIEMEGL